MNRDCIKIGKPEVIYEGSKVSLRAVIQDGGKEKTLEYSVDQAYGQYLTSERSDAFVTALLYYAMVKQMDIEWETPCNERLIYQLKTFFIPVYDREYRFMHTVALRGPTTAELLLSQGGAATGISNGVDSCYTIHQYLDTSYQQNKLTHLLFTDWFNADQSEEYQSGYLEQYLSILPQCAEELGLGFIYVAFHIDQQFSIGHIYDKELGVIQDLSLYTLKFCSTALALQKLLRTYYFSSGCMAADFSFKKNSTAWHDIFTLPLLTTEALSFYSAGMELPRIDKVKAIADWSYTQKHLQVCMFDLDKNCGHCSKCIRTMSELYALDQLEMYRGSFPVDDYLQHLPQRFAEVLMEARAGHVYEQNILEKMKEVGKKVPLGAYLLMPSYALKEFIRIHLRTKKWARKLYRKFHFDLLLYGRSTEQFAQSIDREILGDRSLTNHGKRQC